MVIKLRGSHKCRRRMSLNARYRTLKLLASFIELSLYLVDALLMVELIGPEHIILFLFIFFLLLLVILILVQAVFIIIVLVIHSQLELLVRPGVEGATCRGVVVVFLRFTEFLVVWELVCVRGKLSLVLVHYLSQDSQLFICWILNGFFVMIVMLIMILFKLVITILFVLFIMLIRIDILINAVSKLLSLLMARVVVRWVAWRVNLLVVLSMILVIVLFRTETVLLRGPSLMPGHLSQMDFIVMLPRRFIALIVFFVI